MQGSTIFTIGTALRRAESNNIPVEVLVQGHWLSGLVAGVDTHGIVLSTHSEHCVVRLESITAVRIPETVSSAPVAETFDQQHAELTVHGDGDAWAMPSPHNS
jgi:sRNA-binding regulator protein Hfq